MADEDDIPFPCVRNCCLDTDDICLGCFRHVDEIVEWSAATADRKREILAQAERRREQKTGNRD